MNRLKETETDSTYHCSTWKWNKKAVDQRMCTIYWMSWECSLPQELWSMTEVKFWVSRSYIVSTTQVSSKCTTLYPRDFRKEFVRISNLVLAWWDSCQVFDPQNCKITNLCCLSYKAFMFDNIKNLIHVSASYQIYEWIIWDVLLVQFSNDSTLSSSSAMHETQIVNN
jgi:hypothetical protein